MSLDLFASVFFKADLLLLFNGQSCQVGESYTNI